MIPKTETRSFDASPFALCVCLCNAMATSVAGWRAVVRGARAYALASGILVMELATEAPSTVSVLPYQNETRRRLLSVVCIDWLAGGIRVVGRFLGRLRVFFLVFPNPVNPGLYRKRHQQQQDGAQHGTLQGEDCQRSEHHVGAHGSVEIDPSGHWILSSPSVSSM